MKFDLCVPAYNERTIIAASLARISAVLEQSSLAWCIVVVDNASEDGTGDAVRSLKDSRISVIRLEEKGKGCAIVAAAQDSIGDIFGFIDADLSVAPSDILPLVNIILKDNVDIVIGSRLVDDSLVRRGAVRSLSSRAFNLFRQVLLGIHVKDSQCGLKIMNAAARDILRSCDEKGWFLDLEFLRRAELAGLVIKEVPIHWDEERFPGRRSKLRVLSDGYLALVSMIRIRRRLSRI